MILELDCGNTLIKWRLLTGAALCSFEQGSVARVAELFEQLPAQSSQAITRCRMVSVRSGVETDDIQSALAEHLGIAVTVARPARRLAGVTNGYDEFAALGLDRWLAVVAAYELARRPCLVIDLGTAATVDLVAGDGRHLGGYITPGLSLLRQQLFGHTQRIRYDLLDQGQATGSVGPGTRTADAVERGCSMMLKSYISMQIAEASQWLGDDFCVYATGGDVALVEDLPGVNVVSDLVFRGLAIACP